MDPELSFLHLHTLCVWQMMESGRDLESHAIEHEHHNVARNITAFGTCRHPVRCETEDGLECKGKQAYRFGSLLRSILSCL